MLGLAVLRGVLVMVNRSYRGSQGVGDTGGGAWVTKNCK